VATAERIPKLKNLFKVLINDL